jgi:predicted nucleic acid-binding protein
MDTIGFDANALITLFSKKSKEGGKARIHFLIDETKKSRGRLVIPAPAFSEFSVYAKPEEIRLLLEERIFRIAPFDTRAALECGAIFKAWLAGQPKKSLESKDKDPSKPKIKFDLQIISIAKITDTTLLITNDRQLKTLAAQYGIHARPVEDIALPDTERQIAFAFDAKPEKTL